LAAALFFFIKLLFYILIAEFVFPQVYIFATTPDDGSAYRKQIQEKAHMFVDLPRDWSDSRCADAVAKCKLDVLIDFNGHTCGERLAIQALRPAPVQVAYLGFPGVIGANFIDFNVADTTVVPPQELEQFQSESIVYMPHCYQINSFRELYQARKQGASWQRKDFGLPERTFVMCTFNRLGRYSLLFSPETLITFPFTQTRPQDNAGSI
jgi:predicted O-linked N-acetylglucosamine transferase (SPINDLY family)